MRFGLFFLVLLSLVTTGCWRDGSNQDFFIASDPVTCTVAFSASSITLANATEGLAYADTTTLVAATTGGISPYTYSGTFSALANLSVTFDGDVVSGVGGAGTPGTYSATVVVVDSTGVCTDSVLVTVTVNSAVPVILPPRIDQADTVDHTNGGTVGGTDSVLGSALSGSNASPDFVGVQSNGGSGAADRVFVIPIDSDGVGLNAATVIDANVTITEVSTSLALTPTTDYTVAYSAGPPETITVTIPGGAAGIALVDGGTYVIAITTSVQNTNGDAFVTTPTNTVRFLTAPDRTFVFEGISSTAPGCAGCHDGGAPPGDPSIEGGIAFPPGGTTTTITLDFQRASTEATVFGATSLARENPAGRSYVTLGAVTGFAGSFNPSGSVLANKLLATPAFGSGMPLFGTTLTGSTDPLGAGGDTDPPPSDPDTGAIVTEGKFVLQVRSWIRGGALATPD